MVSVLLAAYNGERFLPPLLDSLRAQTAECRVLWQDDGSTDATADLLASAGAPFLPGMQQGQHLGAAGNFLSLLAQDDAPYTALCDQDDVWHPDKLARSLARIQEAEARFGQDTPLLVHTDSRIVDAGGHLRHGSFFAHQHWDAAATSLPRLIVQNNATGCTMLMNASLRHLVATHADAERLCLHDWFIALTAAAFGQVLFLPDALVDYRQHGQNAVGASRHGMLRRGLDALHAPEKARARIRLTYEHTRMFRDAYGDALPAEAALIIETYLSTEHQPKWRRMLVQQKGGYRMQGAVARMGQMLFG